MTEDAPPPPAPAPAPSEAPAEVEGAAPGKALSPGARRALQEAAARRANSGQPKRDAGETGGPSGPEPTRYGDWENNGLAIDF